MISQVLVGRLIDIYKKETRTWYVLVNKRWKLRVTDQLPAAAGTNRVTAQGLHAIDLNMFLKKIEGQYIFYYLKIDFVLTRMTSRIFAVKYLI
jgi:hypothetical protein